jgi:signal transduction histidine kinase
LKQVVIPDLAQLHLQTDGSMDYNLTIARQIDRDSVDVYYGKISDGNELEDADLSLPLLKYRSTSIFIMNTGGNVMIQGRVGTSVGENLELSKISRTSELSTNWLMTERIDSITVSATKKAVESTRAFSYQYDTRASGSTAEVASIDDQWKLYIRHRLGSIDAASNSFRRNSMAMSLGILSILGVGIMLIVRNNRKSNDLARQQMEFVAGVSHELRTPLSVIRSASDNMTAGLITDQESARRYGSLIHSESLRLNDLVEQVLEFSGIQSGQRRYEYAPLNLLHLSLNSLKGLGERLDPSRVKIQVVVKACPYIMGDSSALVSVIQNLIINAIKYSPNDPLVRLIIEGGSTDSNKFAMLHVVDKGQGIASDEIKHIFEPFYRAKGVRDQQIKGNGLGLSIVQSIMKQHDGSISVASKPDEGSTFTLTFSWIEPKSKTKPVTANKS